MSALTNSLPSPVTGTDNKDWGQGQKPSESCFGSSVGRKWSAGTEGRHWSSSSSLDLLKYESLKSLVKGQQILSLPWSRQGFTASPRGVKVEILYSWGGSRSSSLLIRRRGHLLWGAGQEILLPRNATDTKQRLVAIRRVSILVHRSLNKTEVVPGKQKPHSSQQEEKQSTTGGGVQWETTPPTVAQVCKNC